MTTNHHIIKEGTRVFLSEIGHRGFIYPSDKSVILLYSVKAEPKSWVGGSNLNAYLVPQNSVHICGSSDQIVPIWL